MKNARPLLLAASTFALLISACSQAPVGLNTPTLAPQFGSTDDDYGSDVALTDTQQVFVLSSQEGYIHDDDGYEEGPDKKALLTLYDASGKKAWSKELVSYTCNWNQWDGCGGSEGLETQTLELDAEDNVHALISTSAVTGDAAILTQNYVYKVSTSGKVVKKVYVGTSGALLGYDYNTKNYLDVAVDKAGAIYVAKAQFSYGDDTLEGTYQNVIAKYSSSGTLQWQRTSKVGTPKAITISESGSVYVIGSTGISRYTNSGSLTWTKSGGGDDITISGSGLYVRKGTTIRKYNGSGTQLWAKTQRGLNSPVIADMTGDTGGNVYLAGKVSTGSSGWDAFVRKLSASGSVLWTKQYGTSKYDDARGIATLDGSAIYTAGATQGSLAAQNLGGVDGYVRKVDGSGNRVWTR